MTEKMIEDVCAAVVLVGLVFMLYKAWGSLNE